MKFTHEPKFLTDGREKLTLVVPCFNEEAVIKLFYTRLRSVLLSSSIESYEIVFVDDGSTDSTSKILESMARDDEHLIVIHLSRNFGHQNALLAGISHSTGNVLITIDADLQDPPELIPELLTEWRRGSKVVNAQRRSRDGETKFKLWTASVYYRLLSKLSNAPVTPDCGDFRLIDGEVAQELCAAAEADPYIRGLVSWLGYREATVKYDRESRAAGSTKYTLLRMLSLARQGLINSTSLSHRVPLSVMTIASFGIVASVLRRSKSGLSLWTNIFANSLVLTVLGQYLDAIQRSSGNRPAFIVDEIFKASGTTTPELDKLLNQERYSGVRV